MKVLRLDLLAFGPFSNGRIDFSKKERALQLVYGPNEAGKSTTLRALLALLYGIPLRTDDAHVHETARLRLGASFADARGRVVNVVRRKGLKNTLLDAAGEPLSEGVMSELLHGIDETMFRNMFGLDHDRLREGGEALLAGEGNLGEGLFSVSLGTRTLRDLKEALRSEAEALYKPRGKTPKLNLALESLREKLKKKRDDALSPSAYAEQTKALDAGERERAKLLADRHALLTERADLSRKLDFLPSLARHAALSSELSLLSGKDSQEAGALPEELLRDLERRYGVALSAEAELPAITEELVRLEQELSVLRARLGSAAVSAKPVATPQRTRLRKLAEEATARTRRKLELCQSQVVLKKQLAELAESHDLLAETPDVAADVALLESIEREGVLETHKRLEEECARRVAQVSRLAAQLGFSAEAPEALLLRLAALALPAESELSELERVEQELERDSERAVEKGKQLEAQRLSLARARAELLVAGELATLNDLNEARAKRDRTLEALLTETSALAVARYRAELTHADALSDRLRRELSASQELARIVREEAALADEQHALGQERTGLDARRTAHELEATRVLAPLGITRARARGLRAKLAKLEVLRDTAGAALAELSVRETVRARTSELSRVLSARLAGEPLARELSDLLSRLRARVQKAREAAEQRARRLRERQELAAQLVQNEAELGLLHEAEARAAERLASELVEGGFGAALSHDEVLACLDDLSLLHERERQGATLRGRQQAIEVQAVQLSKDVAAVVRRYAPAAEPLSLGEQLTFLVRSERGAREASRDRTRLAEELATVEAELRSLGDGAPIEQLRARVLELDPSAARARLFELDASVATLEEEIGALDQQLGRLKAGSDRLLSAPFAVEVAEDVEAELGHARTLLRRYVETKLSLTLISREVERHRQKHQDPLLARASVLFSRLTLGRYKGLSVELDERDEPFVCALHQTGKTVRVSGLSDGTRDQLYLALRIASIERFCSESTALPLVLDDAFIHFDDARAEAALQVLGELCEKTQVLFFTHHARMIELAKRALKSSQLAVHELDPVRGTVAFRDNGPLFADA
jgi:DNA repair exonuclease SbcCD ATPase subunit